MKDQKVFYVIEIPGDANKIVIADNFGQAAKYARETYGPKVRRAEANDLFENEQDIEDVRDPI